MKRLFVTRKYNTFSDRLNIELGKITDNSMPTRASGDYQRYAEGKTEASRIFLLSKLTHRLVLKQLSFFFFFYFSIVSDIISMSGRESESREAEVWQRHTEPRRQREGKSGFHFRFFLGKKKKMTVY